MFADQRLGLWWPRQAEGAEFQTEIGSCWANPQEGISQEAPPLGMGQPDTHPTGHCILDRNLSPPETSAGRCASCPADLPRGQEVCEWECSGPGQEPSAIKVRPVALFLITELCLHSAVVWAARCPCGCRSSSCPERHGLS